MKYYIFSENAKAKDKPLQVLKYEPNDFILGTLAMQYGPIQVIPEYLMNQIKENSAENTEKYIKSILPIGVKI